MPAAASMDIAKSAAFVAPASPIANVAVGTPAGICTIESKESTPCKALDFTGIPNTGNGVIDAAIPGRCAAPPAPAMIHFNPRLFAVLA